MIIDGIFFGFFMFYAFMTSLYGVVKVGINMIPGNEMQKIKKRDTYPQAMSVVTLLIIIIMFSFSM
jgi:hypothetical protein